MGCGTPRHSTSGFPRLPGAVIIHSNVSLKQGPHDNLPTLFLWRQHFIVEFDGEGYLGSQKMRKVNALSELSIC